MFIATGESEEQLEHAKSMVKQRIGFYGSTPAYRPVLDAHGWGEIQPRLHALTKANRWDQLGREISDEMLHTFAAVGEPAEAAAVIKARAAGIVSSIVLDATLSPEAIDQQLTVLRQP